jgi:anti-sigma factor ChrR (cupin superfamily)
MSGESRRKHCERYGAESAPETAALYVVGALTSEEEAVYESHLSQGCEFCEREVLANREVCAEIAFSAQEEAPPAALRERLLDRIRKETSPSAESVDPASLQIFKNWAPGSVDKTSDLYIVRSGQGAWETAGPRVRCKKLAVDEERRYVTMLVRMDPGASYPSHRYAGAEECFVLEGDLHVGDNELGPGDYQYAGEGSDHAVQSDARRMSLVDRVVAG